MIMSEHKLRAQVDGLFGQKTRPGCCPEPEIIPLRTLMINQAREVFCQRRFPASLICC